tara:strand:+ start:357 stop:935 length:579 start_codon:yes stop_codon:yes gene_type:complete
MQIQVFLRIKGGAAELARPAAVGNTGHGVTSTTCAVGGASAGIRAAAATTTAAAASPLSRTRFHPTSTTCTSSTTATVAVAVARKRALPLRECTCGRLTPIANLLPQRLLNSFKVRQVRFPHIAALLVRRLQRSHQHRCPTTTMGREVDQNEPRSRSNFATAMTQRARRTNELHKRRGSERGIKLIRRELRY